MHLTGKSHSSAIYTLCCPLVDLVSQKNTGVFNQEPKGTAMVPRQALGIILTFPVTSPSKNPLVDKET